MGPAPAPTFVVPGGGDVAPTPDLLLPEEMAARSAGLYCLNAVNLLQWLRSIFSVAPQLGCCVRKPYLLPMISPSKYVVSVGLSSVRPVLVPFPSQHDEEERV
ncbi:hypothetical protein DL769_007670 [Monosporascus sp. CRB-8-3]|nr:hypothetical protein DL769_007670 [Monosporascus sp. CRB-8-3]